MSNQLNTIFLVIAFFCAIGALFNAPVKINLTALGLLLVTIVMLVPLLK